MLRHILDENDITLSINRVLALKVNDEPGGIAGALTLLAAEGISVEYMYAFLVPSETHPRIVLKIVGNEEKASEILNEHGYLSEN